MFILVSYKDKGVIWQVTRIVNRTVPTYIHSQEEIYAVIIGNDINYKGAITVNYDDVGITDYVKNGPQTKEDKEEVTDTQTKDEVDGTNDC